MKIDHANVRITQLAAMADWSIQILGLRAGGRLNYPIDGARLYAGDVAHVHLMAIEDDAAMGSEAELTLEYFAFSATD